MIPLIDENFNLHATKIPDQTSGMKVVQTTNLTFVDCGLSCDTFNIVHITSGHTMEKEELSSAVNHYRKKNFSFCVWVNQENLTPSVQRYLEELSLAQQNEEVGMVLNLKQHTPTSRSGFQNILHVDSEKKLTDYAFTIARNWNPTDQHVLSYYQLTTQHYLNPQNTIELLMYQDADETQGTLEMFPTNSETVGLYGLVTLPEYRGKGIGSALMMYALNHAKEMGYDQVILQATRDGIGIYSKLGFKPYTHYFEFA